MCCSFINTYCILYITNIQNQYLYCHCLHSLKVKFFDLRFSTFGTFFNTAASAASQIPLCRRMLGSNPGQFPLRHSLLDFLTAVG